MRGVRANRLAVCRGSTTGRRIPRANGGSHLPRGAPRDGDAVKPSSSEIVLAKNLRLDSPTFVHSKMAILGASGGGKSGAVKRIEEELIRCRLPFIGIDPAGIMWGLRSSFDGRGEGLQVLIVGGEHADVPLVKTAGAEMAREVVEANCQVIFDLSDESETTVQKFLADFFGELYAVQGKTRTPRLVIIDEAHEILPQDVRRSESPAFAAARRIVTRGRNRGLGVCLVSQRPAGIAKSVLTQCGTLLIFGVLGTPDRKAIGDWVAAWGDEAKLKSFDSGVAALEQQECWVWSPRDFKVFERIRVANFTTFHPDFTHLQRMGMLDVQPVTADVSSLVKRLGPIAAKIQEERTDLAELPRLRADNKRLTRALEVATTAKPAGLSRGDIAKETAPLHEELRALKAKNVQLERSNKHLDTGIRRVRRDIELLVSPDAPTDLPADIPADMAIFHPSKREAARLRTAPTPPARPASPPSPNHVARELSDDSVPIKPTGGALRMLRALAAYYPEALSYNDLGVMAEMDPGSGSFSDYRSLLRRGQYVENGDAGMLRASPRGFGYFVNRPPSLTREEIQASALGRVSGGAKRMLQALIEAHPHSLSNEELMGRSEMANSGSYSDYRSLLKRRGFVRVENGRIIAAEVLFP